MTADSIFAAIRVIWTASLSRGQADGEGTRRMDACPSLARPRDPGLELLRPFAFICPATVLRQQHTEHVVCVARLHLRLSLVRSVCRPVLCARSVQARSAQASEQLNGRATAARAEQSKGTQVRDLERAPCAWARPLTCTLTALRTRPRPRLNWTRLRPCRTPDAFASTRRRA